MVAALDLPRSDWPDHPHYPTQLLLLGSHAQFRTLGERLLERAESGGDAEAIGAVFAWWKSAMRNHERYEEHKLYPYLAHRFGIDTTSMEHGHDALSQEDRRVRAAVAGSTDAFVAALRRHQEVLLEHLDHEETVVIPGLLALTPEHFEAYCNHPIDWLLRHHPAAGTAA